MEIGSIVEDNKSTISVKLEDKFPRSVIDLLKDVSADLVKKNPKTEPQLCRLPLIWNLIFTTHREHML